MKDSYIYFFTWFVPPVPWLVFWLIGFFYVKNDEGKDVLDRVDTFIGRSDRDEFTKVAHTEKLSRPGTIFRYASYVQE